MAVSRKIIIFAMDLRDKPMDCKTLNQLISLLLNIADKKGVAFEKSAFVLKAKELLLSNGEYRKYDMAEDMVDDILAYITE